MTLHFIDWLVIAGYLAFAMAVGLLMARRASKSVDQFFLTGRSLPWWIAGTSMVATSFAADTPLVISGWVRDSGIWMNWAWWCFAITGLVGTFLFARLWRRGEVMTKAEVVGLRYGGREAKALRGTLGVLHAGVINTVTLCWVMLAATKILEVLFAIPKGLGVGIAAILAVSYSALSGMWGVVITDVVQFIMAVVGAIALAVLSWEAIGGQSGLYEAVQAGTSVTADTLRMIPASGDGGLFDASFWTASIAALAVYLGVSWWAVESIDGSGVAVQRISATRSERDGLLAFLWFNILHYALRPWPWIIVGIASLVVLPHVEVTSPVAGVVVNAEADAITIVTPGDSTTEAAVTEVTLTSDHGDWLPLPKVVPGETVKVGAVIGRTDSEKAYVFMMKRYLPAGLLGLVLVSLLAAFMSTIDTHVNLASAFFVNDVYRPFIRTDATDKHYIGVARITSFVVLAIAGVFTMFANSIGDLFLFFLAFLSGVGPVYILRWLWWRVRAATEITAMISSGVAASVLTFVDIAWPVSALTPKGELSAAGRLCIVVGFSMVCSLISILVLRRPDPSKLVGFYTKVRPAGWWGPVRALTDTPVVPDPIAPMLVGIVGGLALIFGLLFGTGDLLIGTASNVIWSGSVACVGALGVAWSLWRTRAPG